MKYEIIYYKVQYQNLVHISSYRYSSCTARWISANPGLKFNPLFQFAYFCMSVYFKISEKKTPIDPDMICEQIFPNLKTSC
jgi:hypothetical protein